MDRLSKIFICLAFLSMITLIRAQPVLMTQEIGQEIFQQHKYYLIYVYEQASPQILTLFNEHCENRTNCAVLNSTVQKYDSVRKFVGKKDKQFFLILNVAFKKKYVLEINPLTITQNDLVNFEKKYEEGNLSPFYTSEPLPKNVSETSQELVGKSYTNFLKQPAVLKVVYTYTKHQACANCIPMLKDYISLAEKMHSKSVVIFGYIDIFANDLPKISQPMAPHFYIYQGNEIVKQVNQGDFEQLAELIKKEINRIRSQLGKTDDDSDSSSSDESNQEQL